MSCDNIVIQNSKFALTIKQDATLESLICKKTNEECLYLEEKMVAFSLTEERPYNNEIKLAYPNKKTTFKANSVKREGNKLIIGFELITFKAIVEIVENEDYVSFKLIDYIITPEDFGILTMTPPPVYSFRLLQLPVLNRTNFGEWLNVMWDEKVAVNLLANCPTTIIDCDKKEKYTLLTADCYRDIKIKNEGASLIVNAPDKLLDSIDVLEHDYNLPLGVESRRNETINKSIYWTSSVNPKTVDREIARAKKGGFTLMLIYYSAPFKTCDIDYGTCGTFEYNEDYPNGEEDLKAVIKKIRDAGIMPGFHLLHTHIGKRTKYFSSSADHRLNLKRHFTISKAIDEKDDVIYVEENPAGCEMVDGCRLLAFEGEVISYESYTTEYPYYFKGCKRGELTSKPISHNMGTIGGLLDVSEFLAGSVHINQNSSLQDEIADEFARVYSVGFEFLYFDGSEGTNPPYEYHIPNAQYRIYKKLDRAPLFCEGAAKAHFSWHILSGANAFDTFAADVFKKRIVLHPCEQAPRIAKDFTRVNFGWWRLDQTMQPDHYEYGLSKATAWNCPVTVNVYPGNVEKCNRIDDIFEAFRRWEYVKNNKLLTQSQLEEIKNPDKEYTLLLPENGEYELCEYTQIKNAACGNSEIRAFIFERKGTNYVVYWHTNDKAVLSLKASVEHIKVEEEIDGKNIEIEKDGEYINIPVDNKKYIKSSISKDELIEIFEKAIVVDK